MFQHLPITDDRAQTVGPPFSLIWEGPNSDVIAEAKLRRVQTECLGRINAKPFLGFGAKELHVSVLQADTNMERTRMVLKLAPVNPPAMIGRPPAPDYMLTELADLEEIVNVFTLPMEAGWEHVNLETTDAVRHQEH